MPVDPTRGSFPWIPVSVNNQSLYMLEDMTNITYHYILGNELIEEISSSLDEIASKTVPKYEVADR